MKYTVHSLVPDWSGHRFTGSVETIRWYGSKSCRVYGKPGCWSVLTEEFSLRSKGVVVACTPVSPELAEVLNSAVNKLHYLASNKDDEKYAPFEDELKQFDNGGYIRKVVQN
jgi:hypothetical protein